MVGVNLGQSAPAPVLSAEVDQVRGLKSEDLVPGQTRQLLWDLVREPVKELAVFDSETGQRVRDDPLGIVDY